MSVSAWSVTRATCSWGSTLIGTGMCLTEPSVGLRDGVPGCIGSRAAEVHLSLGRQSAVATCAHRYRSKPRAPLGIQERSSETTHLSAQRFAGLDQLATKVVADPGRHIAMQKAPEVGPGIPVRDIGIESLRGPVTETADEWNARRKGVYESHRNVFLTHIIRPSSKAG